MLLQIISVKSFGCIRNSVEQLSCEMSQVSKCQLSSVGEFLHTLQT